MKKHTIVLGKYQGTDKCGTLEWTSPDGEPLIAWGEFNIYFDEHGHYYLVHDVFDEENIVIYSVRATL